MKQRHFSLNCVSTADVTDIHDGAKASVFHHTALSTTDIL